MRVVRNIVNTGRTIACTIHQPAIDIFEVRSDPYVNARTPPVASALICNTGSGCLVCSGVRIALSLSGQICV